MSAIAPTIVELGALPMGELSAELRRSIRSEWERFHRIEVAPLKRRRAPSVKRTKATQSWKAAKLLVEQGLKRCPRCGETKPMTDFWANGYCALCGRAKDRDMHRHRLITKPCPTCGVVKDRSAFPPGSGRHGCLECKANPPPKPPSKWKPSMLTRLKIRRAKTLARLARLEAQIQEATAVA